MPPPNFLAPAEAALSDLGAGAWIAALTAAGSVLVSIGYGFKWLIDRFLSELGKRDEALKGLSESIKEVAADNRREATANRTAIEKMEAGFVAKLGEVTRESRADTQRVMDRQFGLSESSLEALTGVKQEVGEVKKEVGEVRHDVAEVKKDVSEIGTKVERLTEAVVGQEPPKSPPKRGGQ
jgi:uncharacterized protein YoxC